MIATPGQPEETDEENKPAYMYLWSRVGRWHWLSQEGAAPAKIGTYLTSIHQTPTNTAEVVRHSVPRGNSLSHGERLDFVLAPNVLQRSIANSEI